MTSAATALEEPLPKPGRDILGYASARVLEALLEAILSLEYLERGYTRNAAGKAFQAWRALTAAILALEKDRILEKLERDEERKWFREKAVPRVPTTRLKLLAALIEDLGYTGFRGYTAIALDLHDYQYHGPDPDLELSKYLDRHEAARETRYLVEKLTAMIEERLKQKLEQANRWTDDHAVALKLLKQKMGVLDAA